MLPSFDVDAYSAASVPIGCALPRTTRPSNGARHSRSWRTNVNAPFLFQLRKIGASRNGLMVSRVPARRTRVADAGAPGSDDPTTNSASDCGLHCGYVSTPRDQGTPPAPRRRV